MEGVAQDLTFSEAVHKLEAIVAQLEENDTLGLEQALALYEQGIALSTDCRDRLTTAKLKMTTIDVSTGATGAEPGPA